MKHRSVYTYHVPCISDIWSSVLNLIVPLATVSPGNKHDDQAAYPLKSGFLLSFYRDCPWPLTICSERSSWIQTTLFLLDCLTTLKTAGILPLAMHSAFEGCLSDILHSGAPSYADWVVIMFHWHMLYGEPWISSWRLELNFSLETWGLSVIWG